MVRLTESLCYARHKPANRHERELVTRTPSAIRTHSGKGVSLSVRDFSRIRLMARWHSVTAEHLARAEQDPTLWSPAHATSQTTESRAEYARAVDAIKRRLRTLKAIEADPGTGIGPLLATTLAVDGRTAYYATRIGGRAATTPWTLRDRINPLICQHAWMAADIGMALEAHGYTVLSERELSTGIDRHGERITAKLESQYVAPNGRAMNKKPDVAVLHPNGTDYIAIEVERDTDRAVSVYEQKLAAYRANTAVKAVWYLCASDTTARRVGMGAQKALGRSSGFPLRIKTVPSSDGFHFLDMDALPAKLQDDLATMSELGRSPGRPSYTTATLAT